MPTFRIPTVRLRRPSLLHPERMAGWGALALARARLRHITAECSPDIIHANSLTAMLALSGATGASIIWHVRDLKMPPRLARWVARRADTIIAISPAVETKLQAVLPEELRPKIHLIENGIPLSGIELPPRQEARRLLGLPDGNFLVGMLAHLIPWKRHDRLIAAAARLLTRHPDMRFAIAGDDLFGEHADYRRQLLRQISQAGLEQQMILVGATARPRHFLRALDLLVHPTDEEPFGRVICEAMAVGTPVIAIDRAGPHDILEHGVSGWLLDSGDPDALASAIERLTLNGPLREQLARGGAERVRKAFDIANTAARIAALYVRH